MSFRWPNKDPDETLDYSIDWSRFLGSSVSIASVVWHVESTAYPTKTQIDSGEDLTTASGGLTTDSIQNTAQSNTPTVATINIAGGTLNEEYTFYCTMSDTSGSIAERSIKLRIRER